MLVRDIMQGPVVVVGEGTSLDAAYLLMRERGLRHLPVVREGRVVGVVTDRDLRLATSVLAVVPFPPDARVGEVMSRPPLTAAPLDPVEDAARVMRERKIGCLPVVDGGQLVGIVTGLDLLDALLRLAGVGKAGGRLETCLRDRPGELARLTSFVSARGVNIHSVLTYPEGERCVRTVLRIDRQEVAQLGEALRREGFEVVWPPAGRPAT